MGLALTLARRSLLQRPGRTLTSILGIAVGIATVVAIFTLDHNTLILRAHSDDPDWQAEIEVSPSHKVADPRAELARVPGVRDVSAAFQAQAQLWTAAAVGGTPERVHLVAMEAARAQQLGHYTLLRGTDVGPERDAPTALIGEKLATDLALDVGATVTLAAPRRAAAKECVGGEWVVTQERGDRPPQRSFRVAGVLAREGLGRLAGGELVLVDFDVARELYAGTHFEQRFWVQRDPQLNLKTFQAALGEAWSYDLKKSVIIGEAADERAFRNGVRFAGLLALVLGLYVIFHTLSMSLIERVREVGILHSLGTSRAQIGRVFFTEALLIAGAGGALGLAGGVACAFVLLYEQVTTVGIGGVSRVALKHLFEVPWPTVGPLVAAGVAIALVGSIFPLVKARDVDTVAALRGDDARRSHGTARSFRWLTAALLAVVLPAVYFGAVPVIGERQSELVGVLMLGLGTLALFVAVPLVVPALLGWCAARLVAPFSRLWPLSGKLAAGAITNSPARVAGGIAGLALVTASFVGLHGMTRSLEAEIDVWSREAYRDKIYVRDLAPTRFDDVLAALHEYPGVLGVEPDEARTYAPFLIIGERESELARFGPCADDPTLVAKLRDSKGIILSRRLAKHRNYQLGSEVHVQTPRGAVESFTVIAISDAYGYFPHPDERLYGVIAERWMKELFCIDTEHVAALSVRFEPGVPQAEAQRIVCTALGVRPRDLGEGAAAVEGGRGRAGQGTAQTGDSLYAWHSTDIARDFVLFDIIIAMTVALAGLGVLNGQLLSALARSKELGVLKALGTSARQIAGHVLLESAVIGVLGGGLGCALGLAMIPVIVRALRVISGLPLPYVGAGPYLAAGWIGALVVALLAGLYPIRRMNKGDAVAAVRTGG